jgi:hypothetical protein
MLEARTVFVRGGLQRWRDSVEGDLGYLELLDLLAERPVGSEGLTISSGSLSGEAKISQVPWSDRGSG